MAHRLPSAGPGHAIRLGGLDALRAVAALLVVLHHEVPALAGVELLPRGYLAVDFFFILSGFVVSMAYGDRLAAGMAAGAFLRARLARLYPVMALGIAAGALVAIGQGMPAREAGCRWVLQSLFVPVVSGAAGLYLLDGVQWSLSLELVANAAHAGWLARLRPRGLAVLVAAAFLLLLAACARYGKLGIGDCGNNFAGGIPRVLFAYAAGVLLHRLFAAGRLPRVALPAGVVLLALALVPVASAAAERAVPRWWLEPAIVATAFPVLIAAGTRLRLSPAAEELAAFGGRLSYPLYALHLPVVGAVQLLGFSPAPSLALGVTGSLALAALVARLFEPRGRGPPAPRPWTFHSA